MEQALKKACKDIRRLQDHLHQEIEAGEYDAVHCTARAIASAAFDACHAACCCSCEPAAKK